MTHAGMLVGDLPARARDSFGDRPALRSDTSSRTYSELADRVDHLAGAFSASGVRDGDRIAVLSPNDPGLIEVLLAASLVGAAVVPMNPRLVASDVRFQADDADVRFAVVHPALEPLARDAGLSDRHTWFVGDGLERLVGRRERYTGPRPSDDAVLVQLYTSGTTGRPKGCLLTQRGWLSAIAGLAHAIALTEHDVVWTPLPLFHVAGIHYVLATLAAGATQIVEESGDADEVWRVIETHRVTLATLFPNPQTLVAHPDARRAAATLRIGFSLPIGPSFHDALPGLPAATSYGATELGGMALVACGDVWDRPGNVIGRPLIGLAAAVLDDDDRPAAPGEVGELCFRGAAVTVGYWNLPDATAEVLRNGWLHTGDLGRADEDGVLYFVDRKKDMVKPGGENVYSIEVERVLLAHPDVADCAVIGVPDERWGEAVKAVVVVAADVTAEDLDTWCLERLASFKRPRWYEFVSELPRNAMAKVVKPELRAAHDSAKAIRLPERT